MKRVIICLLTVAASLHVQAADMSIEACVSTRFSESASGDEVGGFSSTCYPMEGSAVPVQNMSYKSESDAEMRDFFVGLCNTSDDTVRYTVHHELAYTIVKNIGENEKIDVSVSYDPIPESVTEGSGTSTSTTEFEMQGRLCTEFLFRLSTRYEVFSGLDPYRLASNHDINGLFFDPDNPGHGFDFNAHELGLTIYYYGHTASGERLWLISDLVKGKIDTFQEIALDMYEVPVGVFGQPLGDSACP